MKIDTKGWGAIVFFSFMAAIITDYYSHYLFWVFKPLTTLLILFYIFFNTSRGSYTPLIVMALLFCLLGDILLLFSWGFVYGLASFLIGHLLFSFFFIKRGADGKPWGLLLVWLIVGGLLYSQFFPQLGVLKVPVMIYIFVICLMVHLAWSLWYHKPLKSHLALAIGALFFMTSDAFIGIDRFLVEIKCSGLIILSTYWGALILMVYGFTHTLKR